MDNIIYRRVYKGSKESPDGETPYCVFVTREVNCWIVWEQTFEMGTTAILIEKYNAELALERAVDLYRQRLGEKHD